MKNPAFNCCIEPLRPQLEDPPPREPDVRESIEDYLARGGRIERLPPKATTP